MVNTLDSVIDRFDVLSVTLRFGFGAESAWPCAKAHTPPNTYILNGRSGGPDKKRPHCASFIRMRSAANPCLMAGFLPYFIVGMTKLWSTTAPPLGQRCVTFLVLV